MAVDGPTFGVLQSVVNAFSVELEAARLDIVTYYYTVGPGQNQRLGDDEYTAGLLNQGGQGGHPAPLASRFHSIPTHFSLNLHESI